MVILLSVILALTDAGVAGNLEGSAPRNPNVIRGAGIEMEPSAKEVGRYEKLELLIRIGRQYDNPFDPDQVDLAVLIKTPAGEEVSLPAFFCQDYERRKLNQGRGRANWYYPVGKGIWKARFAPMATGDYSVVARLKDRNGTIKSKPVQFNCTPSASKGFLGIGKKDPRFLEFTDGAPFFAIGQNLAFIGQGQYVNLTKAEQIFAKLSQNGANFLRIWTCCKDWAMAIEARKSAWGRSWSRNWPPGSESRSNPRKCVKIEGGDGASISVSPSHPVALRSGTRYVLSGQFMADGPSGLKLQLSHAPASPQFESGTKDNWKQFSHEFVTGENTLWLGRLTLSLTGSGKIWLDGLSLKPAAGGPELLAEVLHAR